MTESLAANLGGPQLVALVCHWLSLWFGLYLLGRRPRSVAIVLSGFAVVAVSLFLLLSGLLLTVTSTAQDITYSKWLGVPPAAAALYFHATLHVTGVRLRGQRVLLVALYGLAVVVVGLTFVDGAIYVYSEFPPRPGPAPVPLGPLYPLVCLEVVGALAAALVALVVAYRSDVARRPVSRECLRLFMAGIGLILFAAAALFANALAGFPVAEMVFAPLLAAGAVLAALALVRYPGLLEGQLLRADLRSSLLAAALLMAAYLALMLAVGASFGLTAALGWFVLAGLVHGDELRALADRLFFGAGARAQRAALRHAAAYAGSGATLDLAALAPGHSAEVIGLMSEVDRAAAARLEGARDPRLELLAREEFAAVREALALPLDWAAGQALPQEAIRAAVAERLEPRQRQALGLKYLGYADKEMAALMGVRPGVPRSYLSAGKRKLGLATGAPLMLYVHFAGLLEGDALPLLAARGHALLLAAEGAAGEGEADVSAAETLLTPHE